MDPQWWCGNPYFGRWQWKRKDSSNDILCWQPLDVWWPPLGAFFFHWKPLEIRRATVASSAFRLPCELCHIRFSTKLPGSGRSFIFCDTYIHGRDIGRLEIWASLRLANQNIRCTPQAVVRITTAHCMRRRCRCRSLSCFLWRTM